MGPIRNASPVPFFSSTDPLVQAFSAFWTRVVSGVLPLGTVRPVVGLVGPTLVIEAVSSEPQRAGNAGSVGVIAREAVAPTASQMAAARQPQRFVHRVNMIVS
jgi:hypothetical protein